MVQISRRTQYALLALTAGCVARAQVLTDVPDLTTATRTTLEATSATDDATSGSTAETTADPTTGAESASDATPGATNAATTTGGDESASITSAPTEFETTGGTQTTSGGSVFHGLTDVPTIAGAGIPTLVIPYTAGAPFMQKSSLPEGTVFIVVGAVLAFLGACVLAWRGMVAWSINRSVRKAALASIRGNEKHGSVWGGGSYQPANKKGSFYNDANGSSMSLDHLTSTGKPIKSNPFRDHDDDHRPHQRNSAQPPANLFFSPTAETRNSVINLQAPNMAGNRSSSHLPAGYYASPSAAPPASTTLGNPHLSASNLGPYNRHSQYSMSREPSPPASHYRNGSRDGGAPTTGGVGLRPPSSRDGPGGRNSYIESARNGHNSMLYAAPSSSSLMVGTGGTPRPASSGGDGSDLGGSRAPSAYLEDLFENHGNGPMRGL